MDYQRRRPAIGSNSTAAFCKAVAVGMVVGLLLSLAGFYHKSKLESLQEEFGGNLSFQVTARPSAGALLSHAGSQICSAYR